MALPEETLRDEAGLEVVRMVSHWQQIWPWILWGPAMLAAVFAFAVMMPEELSAAAFVCLLGTVGPWRSMRHRIVYHHWPAGAGRCRWCHEL